MIAVCRPRWLWVGFVLVAVAADAQVVVKSFRGVEGARKGVTYEFVATKLKDVSITFKVKRFATMTWQTGTTSSTECKGPQVDGDWFVWACTPKAEVGSGTLVVVGADSEVDFGSGTLQIAHGSTTAEPPIDGLVPLYDTSLVQAVVGGGVSVLRDDYVNFVVTDGTLRLVNDSQLRTAGIAGALFNVTHLPWHGRKKPVGILAGLEFTEGTTRTVDGFQFGVGLGVNRYLTLVGGFALRRGEELSRGFQHAASGVIAAEQAKGNAAYARFPVIGGEEYSHKDLELLDGLDLNLPGGDNTFFRGTPVVESYNSSWFVGVVIPVDLKALLSPK